MKNSYIEVIKYLTYHMKNGKEVEDTLKEMTERLLDCNHYLENLVEFSNKPSAMFGSFVMGELEKKNNHIEMITVLDRKLNDIPEIDEVEDINQNVVNYMDEVINDISKSILSAGLEDTESDENQEEILNIILNEEPISVECGYELDTGHYSDVVMNIECVFNFNNDISVYYDKEVSIDNDMIEETEDGETVDVIYDGEQSMSCNKSIDLSYEGLGDKTYTLIDNKLSEIMLKNISDPKKEELLEYLED